jgi:predicted MFS family arabinose efflux permease
MSAQAAERAVGLSLGQLGILLIGRIAFNTSFRVVYPLLAFLASDMEVSLGTASLLVTTQVAATLLSPLGGWLSDARGERLTMRLGLTSFCAGALVCALTTSFGSFLLGYGLIGLGTALFLPASQSYASARTSYAERGRVLGLLELSWALAALVGVAGLTQLVVAQDSVAPAYWALLGVGLATLALSLGLPAGGRKAGGLRDEAVSRQAGALSQHGVWAALGFVVCQLLAVELIFVVYAAWLARDFAATTEQLGQIFALLGVVELAGSSGAALLTDRVGKRRAVLLGFGVTAILIALLPLSAGRWGLFLTLFLLFDLCFEFAIVSVFPLVSGLARRGRGTVMAGTVAAVGIGRVAGSLLGPRLFEVAGFGANGLAAALIAAAGVAMGAALIREGDA